MNTSRVSLKLLVTLAAIVAGLGTTLSGQRAQRPRAAWPPPVQKVGALSPPLSPEAEMKTFHLPPGYHVELIAAEPLVQDPVAIDYDADGRMYVLEMTGFANSKSMDDSKEPIGRVVILEDTNDDGKMDKRTVFIEGLILPRAVKWLEHGVLVGEPPNLWLAKDTNGDGKADTKELIRNDYGRADGNLEHNANSVFWALDNWLYTSEHDWFLRFKGGKFEVQKTLSRGQWGVSQDDAGRIYRNTNTEALFADIVPAAYFLRNPNGVRTRGAYERLLDPDKTAIWPVRPTRGINRGYREGLLRPDGTAAYYAGVSSPVIYRGDRLPSELYGNAFVVDSPTNLVHRLIVKDDGAGRISAHDAYQKGEILASTDERFRPVNLCSAPDGTLQVVDMYRGVVQDVYFQTEYLRDYIVQHQLELPVGKGRIFRIVHDSTKRDAKPSLSKETPAGLVKYLSHPNGWWRDMAQQLLVERGDTSVAAALTQLASEAPDFRTRLHALWTLDGLDAIQQSSVLHALSDQAPEVRTSALRLSERWLRDDKRAGADAVRKTVLTAISEPNWQVRRQLAATLGELPADARLDPLATLLERYGDDAILVDAAVSSLRGQESAVLTRLLGSNSSSASGQAANASAASASTNAANADAMSMLAAAITKSGDRASIQQLIATAVDQARPAAQRLALLHGLDTGLAGGFRNGGAPAGATGRVTMAAGSVPGADLQGRGGAGSSSPALQLPEEPTALTQLAKAGSGSGGGEAAGLAEHIVARLSWPGKPAPVVPPLSETDQFRFAEGATIYKGICIACHQPDGRGKEHVAPALVGSKFALASPVIPARILLGGKEGNVGLMPPLNALNDEQIAAVLTYIRREWGNTASPVDAATVKEVRSLTASHKRPWTEAELTRLIPAGRPPGAGPGGAER